MCVCRHHSLAWQDCLFHNLFDATMYTRMLHNMCACSSQADSSDQLITINDLKKPFTSIDSHRLLLRFSRTHHRLLVNERLLQRHATSQLDLNAFTSREHVVSKRTCQKIERDREPSPSTALAPARGITPCEKNIRPFTVRNVAWQCHSQNSGRLRTRLSFTCTGAAFNVSFVHSFTHLRLVTH